jgi:putative thioredoxin
MSEHQSQWVRDVAEHDFESAVILRSHDVPVLVDFWAPWCGPCQVLGPILEALADEMAGAFELVKIDTDQNQGIAQVLRIQSIPAVFLFKGGRPVDGFQGALPEAEIRRFLEAHVASGSGGGEGALLDEAQAKLDEGDAAAAAALAERALAEPRDAARAHLLLARAALALGDGEAATRFLDAIPDDAPEAQEVPAIRGALELGAEAELDLESARRRLAERPDDLDARHALGLAHAAAGAYGEALETLLEVVKQDKDHDDGAARKAMIRIFDLLGTENELANEYRRQLSIWL